MPSIVILINVGAVWFTWPHPLAIVSLIGAIWARGIASNYRGDPQSMPNYWVWHGVVCGIIGIVMLISGLPSSQPTGAERAPTTSRTPSSTIIDSGEPGVVTHIFQAGDTLYGLARAYLGDGARWPEIAELNGISDPTNIPNGATIRIAD